MTVAELRAALLNYDPDAEVWAHHADTDRTLVLREVGPQGYIYDVWNPDARRTAAIIEVFDGG